MSGLSPQPMGGSRAFLAWPGKPHMFFAFGWTVLTAVLFWVVFSNANALTATRTARWDLFWEWETRIPFSVPALRKVPL